MGTSSDGLDRGQWYLDDDELRGRRRRCWRQLDVFNGASADDDEVRFDVLTQMLGAFGDEAVIVPRFQCTYGYNIQLGSQSFVNANAFFMDDAAITIGDHSRIGPGAQLMTALHPVEDHRRAEDRAGNGHAQSSSERTSGLVLRSRLGRE